MAIIVQFDYLPLVRDVTEKEVEKHSRNFIMRLNRTVKPRSTIMTEGIKKQKKITPLTEAAEEWLKHMGRKRLLNIQERTLALGFSNEKANKVVSELAAAGMVRKISLYLGKPGRPPILTDFTRKGRDWMAAAKYKISAEGKGGLLHQWWALKIKKTWKDRVMEVMVEPKFKDSNTDVLLIDSSGKRTAIEIAIYKENQIRNIERDLKHFDEVVMATEKENLLMDIKAEAEKRIGREDMKRVRFMLLKDLLR